MTDPQRDAERQKAYERLLTTARKAGVSLDQLHSMLRQLATNEAETRDLLRDTVYGVPDEFLDDLIRLRISDLAAVQDDQPDNDM